MPTNRPPEAKEKANSTTATLSSTSTTQLQYQRHGKSKWRGQRQVEGLRHGSMFRRTCSGP